LAWELLCFQGMIAGIASLPLPLPLRVKGFVSLLSSA
jgi:hypothetical protein